jgi:hypothetical protein
MIIKNLLCILIFTKQSFCINNKNKQESKNNKVSPQAQYEAISKNQASVTQNPQEKSPNNNLSYSQLQNWWNNLPTKTREDLQLAEGVIGGIMTYKALKNIFKKIDTLIKTRHNDTKNKSSQENQSLSSGGHQHNNADKFTIECPECKLDLNLFFDVLYIKYHGIVKTTQDCSFMTLAQQYFIENYNQFDNQKPVEFIDTMFKKVPFLNPEGFGGPKIKQVDITASLAFSDLNNHKMYPHFFYPIEENDINNIETYLKETVLKNCNNGMFLGSSVPFDKININNKNSSTAFITKEELQKNKNNLPQLWKTKIQAMNRNGKFNELQKKIDTAGGSNGGHYVTIHKDNKGELWIIPTDYYNQHAPIKFADYAKKFPNTKSTKNLQQIAIFPVSNEDFNQSIKKISTIDTP